MGAARLGGRSLETVAAGATALMVASLRVEIEGRRARTRPIVCVLFFGAGQPAVPQRGGR